ncbi:MAG: type IV toxin-antitoxin system AbiEi family antitoxin domain-containing protein [Lachnospiraceae bacterium]|nr:type IV toxin-antitoxin system AbiEi family antitoxin domain-containing protein [Lachnospiraceae bacterium]
MEAPFPMDREEKKEYQLEQILKLIEENHGLIKSSDLKDRGVDFRRIQTFVEEGKLTRVKNGYYTSKLLNYSEEQLVVAMFPDGVFTLESGAYYYGYLKKRPAHWSVAISKNTSKSRFKLDYPIVVPFYTEPDVLEKGVREMEIAGEQMKIYTKERLICDILKYQEKMDAKEFKEAVLSYIQDEDKNVADLMMFAKERKVLKKVQMMIGVWL